jgi:hypothetical protein
MNYYGTDLDCAGHFFWKLEEDVIHSRKSNFDDFPFNPETLPLQQKKGFYNRNGFVGFYNIGGYSICAIEGSCYDKRPGSRSIFFIKEQLTNDQLVERIMSIPIAEKIINQMPFNIKFK